MQSTFLRMFSCKHGQTSGSNITMKLLWWNYFVIITKIITKIIVPRNYLVIVSARMVLSSRSYSLAITRDVYFNKYPPSKHTSWNEPKEQRRRRAGKRFSKSVCVFAESVLLCPLKVCS